MQRNPALGALFIPVAACVMPTHAVDYLTIAEAQRALFPAATDFRLHPLAFSDEQREAIKSRAGTRQRGDVQQVWRVERDGELLGWVFMDDVIGKHEFITYATAVSALGEVVGIEIMSYRETHGDEVRQAQWRRQFAGKTLDDRLRLGKDIGNISGATLSCRNITDGVKRLLVQWDLFLRNG